MRQIGPEIEIAATATGMRTNGTPLGQGWEVRVLRLPTTATLRPEAVSARYLMHQFLKQAKVVARIDGQGLLRTSPGGRFVARDAEAVAAMKPGTSSRFLYGVLIVEAERERSEVPAPVSIEIVEPPSAPRDLRAEVLEGEVQLAWMPGVPSPAAPLYNIYRKAAGEAVELETPLNRAPLKTTEYVDTTFHYGTVYTYVVRALAAPTPPPRESLGSPAVEVLPLDVFPPAAPTGLAVTAEGAVIRLYWFPSSEPDLGGYRIYRRDAPEGEWTSLGQTGAAETSFTDATARPAVRYYYSVSAVDSAAAPNEGPRSEERSEVLPPPTEKKP